MEAPKTSLASAVPAALLKKLQSRGGNDRRLTTSLKENKENDDDTSTAPTPEKSTRMPSDRLSPCAREAQRLEEKRRLRRLEQDTARERAALTDETSEFKEMITLFREKNATDAVAAGAAASAERLRVCVRKRPLLPSELQANEFDVITAFGRRAVLHQTRRRVNLERCLENHSFCFDAVFDEAAGTEAVYAATARPLVRGVLTTGGRMTCFAYGQTGSGKTYTMEGSGVADQQASTGLYSLVARDCFAAVEAAAAAGTPLRLSMSMFEIYRETVFDILTPQPSASKVSVLEDAASEVGTLPSSLTVHADSLPHLCTRGRRERGTPGGSDNECFSRCMLTHDSRN
jgi:hypothetical protein